MSIVDRVKNICLTPKTEWPVIAAEPATTGGLITGYVVPLAAIGAVAGFIGRTVVGTTLPFVGTYRASVTAGLAGSVLGFVMAIVSVFIVSIIINGLAPTFNGQKDSTMAMKVAVYAYTPAWVAGVLTVLPLLGVLAILAGLYGIYLLYLGLPVLMKCPQDKSVGYTVVTVVCAIVVSVVLGMITAAFIGVGMMGAGAVGGGMLGSAASRSASSGEVQFDRNSTLGKLQEFGKKMEESNKKMEAAQKSGDANATAAAAMEGLGTLLGGGKHVDPVGIDQLKPFVPDTFAGLPKKSSNAEKTGIAALMVSKAEATYGDGADKNVSLTISDTGGASGLMGLASWASVQQEKDDDNVSERTRKVDGRLVHEKMSKRGGSNEFEIVLGDRFVVSASGNVDLKTLEGAVTSLDLAKLESMKNAGVSK
jgi:hypothetical protein